MGEKFFRNIVSNAILGLSVLMVFVVAFSTTYSPMRGEVEGAISRGQSTTSVSLVFHVNDGTQYIDQILTALDSAKVTTTFFVTGNWVSENESVLKQIGFYGHEIGNHGYFYKNHSQLSAERNREEILVTHKLIAAMLNVEMNLFAPPAGVFSRTTIDQATKLGYRTILWSHDTLDLQTGDPEQILQRATADVTAGSLILMHPTQATATALPGIISALQAKGLGITTVTQTLATA